MTVYKWLVLCFGYLFVLDTVSADILGEFNKIDGSPGYIESDKSSPWYRGLLIKTPVEREVIDYRSPSKIIDSYFPQGKFSKIELRKILISVKFRMKNAWLQYCSTKFPENSRDKGVCYTPGSFPKLEKKWQKKNTAKIFTIIIKSFEALIKKGKGLERKDLNNTKKGQAFLSNLFNALNLWQAFKEEDDQQGLNSGVNQIIFKVIPNYLGGNLIIEDKAEQAANLLVPKDLKDIFPEQKYLSRLDLKRLQKDDYNLAKLDPPSSGMWRKPTKSIRKFDVTNYDKMGLESLEPSLGKKGALDMLDPTKVVDLVYNPKKRMSGTTPKIYAKIGKQSWKIKIIVDKKNNAKTLNLHRIFEVLVNASEVNVENVANNLAAAIGYTVDPTYYKKKVRLFFDDKVYKDGDFEKVYEDFFSNLEETYPDEASLVKGSLKNIKIDSDTGRHYIEIKGVGLEKKSDRKTDINVGFFNRGSLGRSMMREHRAFAMFLSWIDDPDLKNENTKLKLIPDKEGYKVVFSNSDMGASFGHGMPNFFNKSFIRKVKYHRDKSLRKIEFRHRTLYKNTLIDTINFSDLEWLTRRIAQFTLEQFDQAFLSAGFPEVIAQTFARKLMSRRNELVTLFGYEGKVVIDDEGQPVVINLEEGFEDSIPGYEKYFKEGLIQDPENELYDPDIDPFPRHWGAYWTPTAKGEPQSLVWKHLLYTFFNQNSAVLVNSIQPGFYSTDNKLGFSRMSIADDTLGDCPGCFFQGVSLGVSGFIPFRLIVDNPDKSNDKPFLVIELFRFGFNLGTNFLPFLERFGLNAELASSGIGFGARGFKVFEFMKIRAVKEIAEYTKDYKFTEAMKLVFKTAKKEFVEKMSEGDSLIVSQYTGGRVRLRARSDMISSFLLSPELTIDHVGSLVSRVVVYKHHDNKFIVNWGGEEVAATQARIGLRVVLPLNILSLSRERLESVDRSFVFDGSSLSEKKLLLNNLTSKYPKDIPKLFKLSKRRNILRQHKFSVGFSNFINMNRYKRKVQADIHDYANNKRSKEIFFEAETSFNKMKRLNTKTRSYTYKASINKDNDAFFKISMNIHQPEARKRHFQDIFRRIMPIVHDDFILFNPASVKELMGNVDFEAESIISNEGLDLIFSMKTMEVCETYAKINNFKSTVCLEVDYRGNRKIKSFMKDFNEGKKAYIDLKLRNQLFSNMDSNSQEKIFDSLKQIVDLFSKYNKKYNVLKVFRELLPEGTYYQYAKMKSSLSGFPHDENEITMHPINQGKFLPSVRHLAKSANDAFAIFSDGLVKKLSKYFFTDMAITD